MDELEAQLRLRGAAEAAARRARPPGAAITLRRARRRRVVGASATALLVVALLAGMVGAQQQFGHRPPAAIPAAPHRVAPDPRTGWLPLNMEAIRFAGLMWQRDGHPIAPAVVVATGERGGVAWRLVAYRSTDTAQGQPPLATVCTLLEWAHADWDGTCWPQATTTTAVRKGGGGPRVAVVLGRAPATATHVRLALGEAGPPAQVPTYGAGAAIPGRFYLAFATIGGDLERVVAVDGSGRQVGQAQGPGPLDIAVMGDPPSGRVAVVAAITTSGGGTARLLAYPTAQGYCMQTEQQPTGQGGATCDDRGHAGMAFEPLTECEPTRAARHGLAFGGAPPGTRVVRLELGNGWRTQVAAKPPAAPFNRAFFLAELPAAAGGLHVTALDQHGRTLMTWQVSYGC